MQNEVGTLSNKLVERISRCETVKDVLDILSEEIKSSELLKVNEQDTVIRMQKEVGTLSDKLGKCISGCQTAKEVLDILSTEIKDAELLTKNYVAIIRSEITEKDSLEERRRKSNEALKKSRKEHHKKQQLAKQISLLPLNEVLTTEEKATVKCELDATAIIKGKIIDFMANIAGNNAVLREKMCLKQADKYRGFLETLTVKGLEQKTIEEISTNFAGNGSGVTARISYDESELCLHIETGEEHVEIRKVLNVTKTEWGCVKKTSTVSTGEEHVEIRKQVQKRKKLVKATPIELIRLLHICNMETEQLRLAKLKKILENGKIPFKRLSYIWKKETLRQHPEVLQFKKSFGLKIDETFCDDLFSSNVKPFDLEFNTRFDVGLIQLFIQKRCGVKVSEQAIRELFRQVEEVQSGRRKELAMNEFKGSTKQSLKSAHASGGKNTGNATTNKGVETTLFFHMKESKSKTGKMIFKITHVGSHKGNSSLSYYMRDRNSLHRKMYRLGLLQEVSASGAAGEAAAAWNK